MKNYISILYVAVFLFSCTNDRYLEIDFIDETWKKDSVVVTTTDTASGQIYPSTVISSGASLLDTLVFDYQYMEFRNSFLLIDEGESYSSVENGTFKFQGDSLFFFGENNNNRFKVKFKTQDNLVLENTFYASGYKTERSSYYSALLLDLTTVSFKDDIFDPIIYNDGEGKCMPCHSDGTSYPVELYEVNLAYEELINNSSLSGVPLINTEVPDESYLYRLVSRQETINMPVSNDDALSSSEVELFLRWIEQGALNN